MAPAPAAEPVYRVPLEDSPQRGPKTALVTIVESSDFECPFCRRVAPTLKQIESTYGGKVRFVFKQNPLPMHANSLPAAKLAEEARAQGGDTKFWALHDKIFALPALDCASLEKVALEEKVFRQRAYRLRWTSPSTWTGSGGTRALCPPWEPGAHRASS